jgi:hypothetical protein
MLTVSIIKTRFRHVYCLHNQVTFQTCLLSPSDHVSDVFNASIRSRFRHVYCLHQITFQTCLLSPSDHVSDVFNASIRSRFRHVYCVHNQVTFQTRLLPPLSGQFTDLNHRVNFYQTIRRNCLEDNNLKIHFYVGHKTRIKEDILVAKPGGKVRPWTTVYQNASWTMWNGLNQVRQWSSVVAVTNPSGSTRTQDPATSIKHTQWSTNPNDIDLPSQKVIY